VIWLARSAKGSRERVLLALVGVSFALVAASRMGPEERLMREEFGPEYEGYSARTGRLIP